MEKLEPYKKFSSVSTVEYNLVKEAAINASKSLNILLETGKVVLTVNIMGEEGERSIVLYNGRTEAVLEEVDEKKDGKQDKEVQEELKEEEPVNRPNIIAHKNEGGEERSSESKRSDSGNGFVQIGMDEGTMEQAKHDLDTNGSSLKQTATHEATADEALLHPTIPSVQAHESNNSNDGNQTDNNIGIELEGVNRSSKGYDDNGEDEVMTPVQMHDPEKRTQDTRFDNSNTIEIARRVIKKRKKKKKINDGVSLPRHTGKGNKNGTRHQRRMKRFTNKRCGSTSGKQSKTKESGAPTAEESSAENMEKSKKYKDIVDLTGEPSGGEVEKTEWVYIPTGAQNQAMLAGEKVHSNVIDAFLEKMRQTMNCHTLETYIYTYITDHEKDFSEIYRTMKKHGHEAGLKKHNIIIMPIFEPKPVEHWAILVICKATKEVYLLDSAPGYFTPSKLDRAIDWINQISTEIRFHSNYKLNEEKYVSVLQKGLNCCAHACANAFMAATREPLSFNLRDDVKIEEVKNDILISQTLPKIVMPSCSL